MSTTQTLGTSTRSADPAIDQLHVVKELEILAPLDIVWETVLEEVGGGMTMPDGTPMDMKIEPWPGGRWFRDLGNNTGHFWGHVQVIKPPALLEICGPMFMSYACSNHVQYRLMEKGKATILKLTHRAIGLIDPEHAKGVQMGWQHMAERIQKQAEKRVQG